MARKWNSVAWSFLLLLAVTSLTTVSGQDDNLVVQTTKGKVRGATLRSGNGKQVDAFLGIPYAKPPTGKLRFRHPKPMDPWEELLDARSVPNSCFQVNDTQFGDFKGSTMWNPNSPLSEDCLSLNVWVPKPRPKNAAVLVWFYGGGFYSGTITLDVYDPKILVSEEQIIVVSINYRVASLGFLCFSRADVPGNAGLFDQLMGMEWVRDNIASFGGNPANVTLFGESAGAVSVGLHLLSPLSRHMFSQGILQSGSATSPWAVRPREESKQRGLKLAKSVGCPSDERDMDAVVECLRDTDPFKLVSSEWVGYGVVEFPFAPVVDGSFLDESPASAMAHKNFKKTNILAGSNTDEANYFILYYLTDLFKNQEDVYVNRQEFLEALRLLNPDADSSAREAIAFEYTDWSRPEDTVLNRDALDKMVGDRQFICSVNEFAARYAEIGADVFMYYFSQRSSIHPWPKWTGVLHADEINFIFGEPLDPSHGYNKAEERLSKRIMRYWANFARTGNPSQGPDGGVEPVHWPAHSSSEREYLTLHVNSSEVGRARRARQCAFWQHYLPTLQRAGKSGPCTSGAPAFSSYGLLLAATSLVVVVVRPRYT